MVIPTIIPKTRIVGPLSLRTIVYGCALLTLGVTKSLSGQTFQPRWAMYNEDCLGLFGVSCSADQTERITKSYTQQKFGKDVFGQTWASASHCTKLTDSDSECAASVSATTDPFWNRLTLSYAKNFVRSYGSYGSGVHQFISPRGVAISRRDGNGHAIFIADAGNNRIAVVVLNHETREVFWDGVIDGSDAGLTLNQPFDVAYDPGSSWSMQDDRIFILDSGNNRVLVYNVYVNMNNGTFTKQYLGKFGDSTNLSFPIAIAVRATPSGIRPTEEAVDVAITDRGNRRVVMWSFNPATSVGTLGPVSDSLPGADLTGVSFDAEGSIVVADRSHNDFLKLSTTTSRFDGDKLSVFKRWTIQGRYSGTTGIHVGRAFRDDGFGKVRDLRLAYLHTTEEWSATNGMQTIRMGTDVDSLIAALAPDTTSREAWFQFLLTGNATYSSKIVDGNGALVRNLGSTVASLGPRTTYWNGYNDAGVRVGPGLYTYVISYESAYAYDDGVLRSTSVQFRLGAAPVAQPLVASISGPSSIVPTTTYTWTGGISGGFSPYAASFSRRDAGGQFQIVAYGNTYTGSSTFACTTFDLTFDVTSSDGQASSAAMTVNVGTSNKRGCETPLSVSGYDNSAPPTFELAQEYSRSSASQLSFQRVIQRVAAPSGNIASSRAVNAKQLRENGVMSLRFGIPRPAILLSKTPTASSAERRTTPAVGSPGSSRVIIRLFNSSGQLIRLAANEILEPGYYRMDWDGLNDAGQRVAPGVYTAVMTTPGFRRTTKLIVVR